MSNSAADELRTLLASLEAELAQLSAGELPSLPKIAEFGNCVRQMVQIAIATVRTCIVTIERLEESTQIYCALRSGVGRNLPN